MGGGFDAGGKKLGIWRFLGGKMRDSELPTDEEFGEYIDIPHDDVMTSREGEHTSAPDEKPEWTYNWDEDRGAGEHPNSYFFYLPRLCNHCTRPACLEACPRDAIYKREEDGIVLVDEDECNGYRFCVEACPYKVIYFNPEEGTVAMGTDDGVEFTADVSDAMADGGNEGTEGIAQKCIGCFPRVEKGVAPACVRQCPGRARFYGYLDEEGTPVHKLVREWEVALPLHPEFNTEPNVYYVPPLSSPKLDDEGRPKDENRIPLDYLEELFGDDVEDTLELLREEREKMKEGEESELMETLIGYDWPDDFFGEFTANPVEAKESRSGAEECERY
ncbi:MAG: 4Fe-4S dicluster domain-containing protein, partial [Halobacteria archaeon]|nr:4Fe-4S dicluster domain-containing protein [Halobacteria archaeon]